MKKMTKRILSFGLGILLGTSAFAQLSKGGTPYTFSNAAQAKSAIQMKQLPAPDMITVAAADAINDASKENYRVGLKYPVNYNSVNSGTWESTSDGASVWRLRINIPGAKALGLYYHNFFIPNGGKVFIYNENQNHVIGAFTSDYNFENTIRATQMIQGETITLEYYAPAGVTQTPIIEISEVAYFYRGVEEFVKPFEDPNSGSVELTEKAESCQVDVACSEITGWEEQRDAVVHYVFPSGGGYAVCTASMVNNTAQDCTPYIISAWHCGEPNAGTNISQWVWYWNYQKTTCSTGSGNLSDPSKGTNTMTGGTVVASSGNGTLNNPPGSNQVAGSDFYLVELNSQPPASYNAYYAGWNRSNTASPSGVGIHHPAGSAKKVSTYTSSLFSATYNGGASQAHWGVQWAQTTNGWGVTEGGSSGSPIYDNNGRMVGQLSGGSSFCSNPTSSDLYGKFYSDWDLNGTTNNARLKPWLDPINSGVTVLDGAYEPCNASSAPTCGINASSTSITAGSTVTFSDGSGANPTSWSWNFDNTSQGGVTPSISSVQNPGTVTYANPGTYEVELVATNGNGSSTCTETIVVTAFAGCDTLLNIQDTDTLTIYGAYGSGGYVGGFYTGINGWGDLAKAEKYSGYSGTHVTGSDIYIFGLEDGGNGSTIDLTIWDDNAGVPGTIIGSATYALADIDAVLTSGQGLVFLPFDAPVNVGGNDFYIGLNFNNVGAGDSLGIVHNSIYDPTPNTAYEQWSDGSWTAMVDYYGYPFSMYVTAHITDAPVSGSASSSTTTACTGGAIDFMATATNAAAYTWYTIGATPSTATTQNTTVTYATAGSYTAYLVVDGDCEGQIIDSVQVTITDGPTLTTNPVDPSCAGNDGTISASATGGAGSYQYSIDGGALQGSGSFTGLSQGTYVILVEDANGCQTTESVTINAGSGALTVSGTPTQPSCAGNDGQIVVVASGGGTSYTYSINGGSTFQSGDTFTGLAPGTYSIVSQDNNGCQGTSTVTLNATTGSVTATPSTTDPSCGASDGQIDITAGGGTAAYTYSINGGSTFQAGSSFTGLAVGTYNIVVEDANGCQGTATATLTNSSGPSVTATVTSNFNGSDVSCTSATDGEVTVVATGGTPSYTYSIDGTNFGASNVLTGVAAGTYTVYVNDAGSCQGTASVTVTAPTAVSHSATVTNASCGSTNGSIVVSATGGTSPYTYSLNSGTAQSSGGFTGLAAGSYTVQAIDANGCTSTLSSETIGGGTAPSITSPTITDETCMDSNGQIIVNATGGTAPLTYSNDGGSTFQSSSVFAGLAAGTYAIIVEDATGCTSSTNATVTNSGGFTLIVNPSAGQTICEGNSANISASGAGTGATYTWDQGLGTGASHNVSPTVTTTYSVTATDQAGCTEMSSTTITVQTEPTVTIIPSNPTICSGDSQSLTATGAQSYVWNTGDQTATINVSPTSQTTYTVIGQNGSCAGTPVQVTVAVNPSPTVVAGSDVTSTSVGGTVNFNNAGSSATSYTWDFGDGQTSTQGFVAHTYNVAGTYTVTLTGTIGSCTATDQITIVVGATGIDQVSLENGVSLYPNPNDGQFNLKLDFGIEQEVDVKLFSAIGQLVESRNLGNVSSSVVEFNLSNHAGGVYFVQVNTSSGTITKRITISK